MSTMETYSADEIALGRGILYYDRRNPTTLLYEGELDLGNCTAIAYSTDKEMLEHPNYRSGLKSIDKELTVSMTPTLAITLDTINDDNIRMGNFGSITSVTQDASVDNVDTIKVHLGKYTAVTKRSIGLLKLSYDNLASGPFQQGETVSQSIPSAATGEVLIVGADHLYIRTQTGNFVEDSEITGGTSSATADVNSDDSVFTTGIVAMSNVAADTWYVRETDYTVKTAIKDDKIGRVFFPADGGTLTEGESVKVYYDTAVVTYKVIHAIMNTEEEGRFRFVQNNAVGTNRQMIVHRGAVSPDGESQFIGDGWSNLGYAIKILKDETQPTGESQYYKLEEVA